MKERLKMSDYDELQQERAREVEDGYYSAWLDDFKDDIVKEFCEDKQVEFEKYCSDNELKFDKYKDAMISMHEFCDEMYPDDINAICRKEFLQRDWD